VHTFHFPVLKDNGLSVQEFEIEPLAVQNSGLKVTAHPRRLSGWAVFSGNRFSIEIGYSCAVLAAILKANLASLLILFAEILSAT